MGNANKDKGKSVEREIAKIFSDATGKNFERVPNSGAFTGGTNSFRVAKLTINQQNLFKGDLIPPEEFSHCVVEVKARKSFPFNQLFDSCRELDSWIKQVRINVDDLYKIKDCNESNYFYCVIFKPNLKGCYICYPKSLSSLECLSKNNWLTYFYNDEIEMVIERFDATWILNNLSNPHFNRNHVNVPSKSDDGRIVN